jgi:hypothetical protein
MLKEFKNSDSHLHRLCPRRLRWLMTGLVMAALLTGGGGCDQISGQPVVQVIGEARLGRKPLADAMVAFVPLELRDPKGSITEVAFGSTDNAGRFEMRTSEARGVLPGEYRVLFFRAASDTDSAQRTDVRIEDLVKDDLPNGATADTSLMLAAVDRMDDAQGQSQSRTSSRVGSVPDAYNVRSRLRFTVKPGSGIIYPKFDLETHPKN